ncbi:hypothetical protein KY285_006821 [Solanum tuberosum]|nr:hypothetical protein KY285_006821 [Solanum tuberosum]
MIAHRLRFKKVLVVLDDIAHNDHLENLAGDLDWFGKGNRIIATTRDKHLIGKNDVVYEVTTLRDHQAIKLFNQYAFKDEVPSECFEKLLLEVVNHAKGLPLALKVWGSFLHKRDITEWRSAIEQMKIKSKYCKLPTVLVYTEGSTEGIMPVEAIWCTYIRKLCFSKEAMNNMKRLRILYIRHTDDEWRSPWFEYFPSFSSSSDFEFVPYNSNCHDGSIEYLPDNLCWFVWHDYPWKSLPENFKPQKLVHLDLRWSSLHKLCTKRKLDLTGSISLMQTPDFMGMPNLEYLNLSGCTSLKEVHHSLGYSRKLIRLEKFPEILGRMKPKLDISVGLRDKGTTIIYHSAPSFGKLKNLVTLHLGDCSKLENLPEEIGDLENLEWLEASGPLISQPPSSIIWLNKLKILNFAKQETGGDLVDGVFFVFPHVNERLRSLETLMLSYCNLIDGGLPEDIGCLSSLKNLYLQGNNFEHLPRSIAQLGSLQHLDLSECRRLKEFPGVNMVEGFRSLKILDLSYCNLIDGGLSEDIGCLSSLKDLRLKEFVGVNVAKGLRSLYILKLSNCNLIDGGLPEDIGCLSSLVNLYLNGNNFEHLPRNISQLGALRYLNLSDCKRLTQLPEDIGCLSSLEELYLNGNNFEHLPRSIAQLGALRSLDLSECRRLTHLPELPPEIYTLHADCHMALKSIHNLVTKKKKSQRLIFTPLSYGAYNGSIYNSFAHALFQNISSLQHYISASDSLSLREFTIEHPGKKIPSWFHHRGTYESVSVNLNDNWYVRDNFLGFAVCYSGRIIETKAYLIPLCNRIPWMIQNLSLSDGLISDTESTIHFFFVPLSSFWDTSKANRKTPNDYGTIGLTFSGHRKDYGFRLLYKDELENEALLQMRGDNDEPTEHSIRTRRSTPVSSKMLQLFPTSPGF